MVLEVGEFPLDLMGYISLEQWLIFIGESWQHQHQCHQGSSGTKRGRNSFELSSRFDQ